MVKQVSTKLYVGNDSSITNLITGDFSSGNLSLGQTTGTVTVLNNFTVTGDADIDGTLEADAITVNGTALDTYISDSSSSSGIGSDADGNTYAGTGSLEVLTTGTWQYCVW